MRLKLDSGTLLGSTVILLIIISSGTLELFKDGGARDEGLNNHVAYHGVLNYVTPAWCVMALLVLLVIAYSRGAINLSRGKVPIAIAVLALSSCAWTDDVLVALKAAFLVSLGTAVVVVHSAERTTEEHIRLLSMALIPLLVGSLITIFFIPSYGVSVGTHEGSWQGLFNHKNNLGTYSAVALAVLLGWRRCGGPALIYAPAALSFFLVLGSGSLTSTGAACVIVLLHLLTSLRLFRITTHKAWLVISALAVAAPLIITLIPMLTGGLEIEGKGTSFSGRGYIWSYLVSEFIKSPIIGHGFNSYKNSVFSGQHEGAIYSSIGFLPVSAHNGFLEAAHSMGIIGLTLSLALVVAPIWLARGTKYFPLILYVCISATIINIFESKLVSFNSTFFILIYTYCIASRAASATRYK